MALANEVLVGRFNEALHKLLNMKEGAPSPQLSPDMTPTLNITGPEWELRRLLGVRSWIAYAEYGAHAGEYSLAGVQNPAGSNVLTVVEGWIPRGFGSASVEELLLIVPEFGVSFTAFGAPRPRDTTTLTNWTGANQFATRTCYLHTAGTPGWILFQGVMAYPVYVPLGIVLRPGDAILGRTPNANTFSGRTFFGYERPWEDSEKR